MDENALGQRQKPHNTSEDFVSPYQWRNIGSLTTAGGVLAAAEHLKATAEALSDTISFEVPEGTVSLEIRFRGTTDNHTPVFELYGCAGDDWYMNLGTYTLSIGTAIGPDSTLFADTITETNDAHLSASNPASAAVNSVARIPINTHGMTSFLLTLSTAAAGNAAVYADWRRF